MRKSNETAIKAVGSSHKQMTIPIFIPHLGCGHACTFCNQKRISGVAKEKVWTEAQLIAHIESWLSTAAQHDYLEIGFFGGSFTGIPVSLQESYLHVGKQYLDSGRVHGIRLSTRPDYLEQPTIDRLKAYGVSLVEIGVQSFSEEVLNACRRGHDHVAAEAAVHRLKASGIQVGIQLMLGLPMDNREVFLESVVKTIELKPDCVRLYPTLVLADTALAEQLADGSYMPLALEEAVSWAADAYVLFMEARIPVIRMGLQASETLTSGDSVMAGPHHDAFRTLVESLIYRRLMERDLENGLPDTRLSVRVHPKHVCFFSGHRQENLHWLRTQGVQIDKIIKDDLATPYSIEWIRNNEGKR